jgi:hypothetical protein
VPLLLWAAGTFVNWQTQNQMHYIKEIGTASGGKIVVLEFINQIWQVGFSVLFVPMPGTSAETANMLMALNRFLVGSSFLFGSIYGLYKRQWNILALLIFLLPYIVIHALHSVLDPRYGVPVNWIVLLICLYGFKTFWGIINKEGRMPVAIIAGLQILFLVPIIMWLITLAGYIGQTSSVSPRCISMPYAAMGVAAVFFVMARILYRTRYLRFDITLYALFCLIIISNQFSLASVVRDGRADAEFKQLADWYCVNAKPNEKMVSLMAGTLGLLAPAQAENFIHTSTLTGQSPEDFIKNCYEKGVTYVVWDSRAAIDRDRRFYNMWHIENINFLSQPRSIGPFEYITTLRENDRRFLYIFRLKQSGDLRMP